MSFIHSLGSVLICKACKQQHFPSLPSSANFNLNVTILHDKLFIFLKRTISSVPPRAPGVLFSLSISLVYKWGSWKQRRFSYRREHFPCRDCDPYVHVRAHACTHTHAHPISSLRRSRPLAFGVVGWIAVAGLLGRRKEFPSCNMLDVLSVRGYVTPYFLIQLTVCLEI